LVREFAIASSPASVANIREHLDVEAFPVTRSKLLSRLLRLRYSSIVNLLTLPCSRYQHVLFQSFEEISTLLFMLRHPGKRVHLIVTNNLTPERFRRCPRLLTFLLRRIFERAASVFVGSQFELDVIKGLSERIDPRKLFVIPYHQIAIPRRRLKWKAKSRTVLYMGPELPHKSIDPVIQLITRDTQRRFRYLFLAMEKISPDARAFLENQPNVRLEFGYVPDDEYYRAFSEAALVIMTHDAMLEGRLSGILCDAIASDTALVARDMAPHNEFFNRFGDMGFLVDYREPGWCDRILNAGLESLYDGFQKNMAACRKASSLENIRAIFHKALSRT
jgi:glycosyltransferase involved in cell wall biosynthesis